MTATKKAEKLRQCEIKFSWIIEQTFSFTLSPNMVTEKEIVRRCFMLSNALICVIKFILLLNSKY